MQYQGRREDVGHPQILIHKAFTTKNSFATAKDSRFFALLKILGSIGEIPAKGKESMKWWHVGLVVVCDAITDSFHVPQIGLASIVEID